MKKSFFKVADNSPVLFEFVDNSNDSLKTKITNVESDKHELKLT